jgi:hypothetical protein
MKAQGIEAVPRPERSEPKGVWGRGYPRKEEIVLAWYVSTRAVVMIRFVSLYVQHLI